MSMYGKGLSPFPSPEARCASSEKPEGQLSSPPVAHKWGIVEPHHFDFGFGLEVRRNHPEVRSHILRAVRLTGSGTLRQEGIEDQPFKAGAILVERSPGGAVRAFSPSAFLQNFERADGGRLSMADEVPFHVPDRSDKGVVRLSRRAA
jgi:hypothetical protein